MKNYCQKCNGSGKILDPDEPYWKIWKWIECPACNGVGLAMPNFPRPNAPPLPPKINRY